jgi:hypothetical protein
MWKGRNALPLPATSAAVSTMAARPARKGLPQPEVGVRHGLGGGKTSCSPIPPLQQQQEFAITHHQLAVNHHQFAVNHDGVQTSPPVARGCTLAPPLHMALAPPWAGTAAAGMASQLPSYTSSPLLLTSPSPGVNGGLCRPGKGQEHLFPSSPLNRGHRPGKQVGGNTPLFSTCARPLLQCGPLLGAVIHQQYTDAIFSLCTSDADSGFQARITFQHHAGSHEVTISCRLSLRQWTPSLQLVGGIAITDRYEPRLLKPWVPM